MVISLITRTSNKKFALKRNNQTNKDTNKQNLIQTGNGKNSKHVKRIKGNDDTDENDEMVIESGKSLKFYVFVQPLAVHKTQ